MEQIKYFKVLGERNSGTNYLYMLMRENFNLQYLGHHWDSIFGWKHDIVDLERIENDPYIAERTLFLYIHKNPYSWAISMHKKPHHMRHTSYEKGAKTPRPFKDFLDHPWNESESFSSGNESRSTITIDLRNYKDLFKMRSTKIKSHLDLENHIDHYYRISYEQLIENPERIIKIIEDKFTIERKEEFVDINFRCDPVPRKELPYNSIKDYYLTEKWKGVYIPNIRKVTNGMINWELEHKLNYERYDGIRKP